MSAVLFYNVLTSLLAPLALLFVLRTRGPWRHASLAVLVVGVIFLFIFSSRRLWFIAIYLCLAVVYQWGGRIKRSWLIVAVAVGGLGAGPLLWSYRQLRRAGDQEGRQAITQAWDAVVGYTTSDDARAEANAWGGNNMEERLGIGGVLYGTAEHVLNRGPNYSPTMFSGVVRWVPTLFWADKNQVADDLDAKLQLIGTGRFPRVDIPVSPITELTFQFGFWLAPLGAAAYALGARFVSRLGAGAMRSVWRFVLWAGIALELCFFDGAFVQVISPLRELVFLATGAWAADAIARRVRLAYAVPEPTARSDKPRGTPRP